MTPENKQRIQQWACSNPAFIDTFFMSLATGTEDDQNESFKQFCAHIREAIPGAWIQDDGEHPSGLPALTVGRHANIAFQLLPMDKWLELFLDAVSPPGSENNPLSPRLKTRLNNRLDQLQLPVSLDLYVARQCPHCPLVFSRLLPMAKANKLLRLNVIDAGLFPETAAKYQVRAVPTVIMEEQFRWTGVVDPEEILDLAIQRNPVKLSPASLRQFMDGGRALQAARMMIDHGSIFPALIDLLTDEKWPTRLAAMVVVECLAEDAPDLARNLVEPLWTRLSSCSSSVKGDVAYILGVIRSDDAEQKLKIIAAQESDAQVKEAAVEALENFSRHVRKAQGSRKNC